MKSPFFSQYKKSPKLKIAYYEKLLQWQSEA